MSKLEELIKEYCPDGVEYKSVGSFITRKRQRGKDDPSVKQVYSISNTLGVVKAEEYRENIIFSEDTSGYTILRRHMFAYNPSRLNIGSIAYLKDDMPGLVSPMYVVFSVDEKVISVEYLNFLLQSAAVKNKIDSLKEEGARFRFDFKRWDLINVPVPPQPVQREIVRILNTFTNLTKELTKELAARKRQYGYYRDKLLSFEGGPAETDGGSSRLNKLIKELCPDGVENVNLNTVCKIYDGTHSTPQYTDHGVKFVSVENINNLYATEKYISEEAYKKYKVTPQIGDILMTRIGSIGVCTVIDSNEPLAYYVSLALLRPDKKTVDSRFLKYAIESLRGQKELRKRTLVNAVPIKVNKDDIGKILIPIPPLSIQREIVAILDRFDALCNDLTSGLPAEIEARQKQYEYYRDRLLSFKPLEK